MIYRILVVLALAACTYNINNYHTKDMPVSENKKEKK